MKRFEIDVIAIVLGAFLSVFGYPADAPGAVPETADPANEGGAGGKEQALFGFERDVVAKWHRRGKDVDPKLYPDTFAAPLLFYFDYRIRKGDATQGEWAMFFPIGERGKRALPWSERYAAQGRGFAPGAYNRTYAWRGHCGNINEGFNRDIFNTMALRRKGCPLPSLDWTGYDILRADVKSGAEAVIRLAVEDEEIMPPVERRFRIPPGEWVTVELDLNKAKEARSLDISRIANLWVFLEETAAPTNLLLDNIRLARADTKPSLRVIADDSPYEPRKRVYAVDSACSMDNRIGNWKPVAYPEKDLPPPSDCVTDLPEKRGPWHVKIPLSGKKTKKIPSIAVSLGDRGFHPHAYDSLRMLVSFRDMAGNTLNALVTGDGGETWTGLDGKAEPTVVVQGSNAGREGVFPSVNREEVYTIGVRCCVGFDYPGDRIFAHKYVVTSGGWKQYPATPVGSDPRHCVSNFYVTQASSGRIWAVYPYFGRLKRVGIGAKYSADGGRTWQSWNPGKNGLLPESVALIKETDAYGGKSRAFLAPWKEHVACAVSSRHGKIHVWVFDGEAWSAPKDVAFSGDGKKAALESRRKSSNATSCVGVGDQLMLITTRFGGVGCFDGESFREENPSEYSGGGFFSVCGKKVLLFAPKEKGKDVEIKTILCWRRSEDGTWSVPCEVVSEDIPISSFRPGIYSPDTFTPLVWTRAGERRLNIMLVPADLEGGNVKKRMKEETEQ